MSEFFVELIVRSSYSGGSWRPFTRQTYHLGGLSVATTVWNDSFVKLRSIRAKAACVLAAAAISSTVSAADNMYVNFGLGGLNVDTNEGRLLELIGDAGVNVTYVSFDTSSTTFFLRGGYEFNDYIALEGLYQDYSSTRTLLVGQVIDPDALPAILANGIPGSGDAYGASARFTLPLNKVWFIDARVGAMSWSSEKILSFPSLDREIVRENSGTDPVYGLGMRFFINHSFEIAAEYQYADFDTKTESYSVVLGYRF